MLFLASGSVSVRPAAGAESRAQHADARPIAAGRHAGFHGDSGARMPPVLVDIAGLPGGTGVAHRDRLTSNCDAVDFT